MDESENKEVKEINTEKRNPTAIPVAPFNNNVGNLPGRSKGSLVELSKLGIILTVSLSMSSRSFFCLDSFGFVIFFFRIMSFNYPFRC